jgi:uroporphyrinogen-III synthase
VTVIVVRPPPGDERTLARLAAAGIEGAAMPLFAVTPVDWTAPPQDRYDALLLTSANAIRHGGSALASLRDLPVVAVGAATARAATDAGFAVAITGDGDVGAAIDRATAAGWTRLLHLAGRDRIHAGTHAVTVYANDTLPIADGTARRFAGATVLLHSARAAARVAALVDRDGVDRAAVRLAALSPAVAAAAGDGWQHVAIAARPTDAALIAVAIDPHAPRGDKTA